MDWATRKVLAWRRSNALDASLCVEALSAAIAKYGKPAIIKTPSRAVLRNTLSGNGSRIAIHRGGLDHRPDRGQDQKYQCLTMFACKHLPRIEDRRRYLPSHRFQENDCRAMDNILLERLWWSLRQRPVSLHELQDRVQAKPVIDEWLEFYNAEQPHTAFDQRTPGRASIETIQMNQAA